MELLKRGVVRLLIGVAGMLSRDEPHSSTSAPQVGDVISGPVLPGDVNDPPPRTWVRRATEVFLLPPCMR